MAERRLRTGVIGLGLIGALHARVHSQLPNARLVAVADIQVDPGRALADELGADFHADYAELLARDDIDAVSICLPDRLHVAPAVAAAQAGKHLLLEKPMAHTTDAATAIAEAVEAAGVRLMVGHLLRFDPRYRRLYEAAAPELLGDPIHLRAKRNTARGRAERIGATTSILFYLGVHDIDMMQWVARSRIARVYAQKVAKLGIAEEDSLYALVTLENGAIGFLDYSWAWPNGMFAGHYPAFEVVGTKSAALLDGRDPGLQLITESGSTGIDSHLWPDLDGKVVGDLRNEIGHFTEALQSDQPFAQDYREALDAVCVLDAIATSIESGQPVDVARG